jgi:immunoglobulin-like protein involved in spore germination/sporulation and spore germination protein
MPMTGRILSALSLIVLALGLAACGGDGGSTTATEATTTFDTDTTVTPTTTAPETTKLRVYFLLNDKVQPVAREVPQTQAVAQAALDELAAGTTASEEELGMTSDASFGISGVTIENGIATLDGEVPTSRTGRAQVVYTLTQFPTVQHVEIDGAHYTRADFEDETPGVLVESPLAFETVPNPIHATGTANTFEATFDYEVVDPAGKVVDKNFVTATSGTGTRGTFDFTTKPYTGKAGEGALVVFEISAKDGSRTKEVRIPVQLEP